MGDNKSGSFVDNTLKGMDENQLKTLEGHFVKRHNRNLFVKALKFSVSAGLVVGTFVGLVALGKSVGDSFSN